KFSRFVSRLRYKFTQLFTKMLEKQLSLKGIMTVEEFALVGPELVYDFSRDNYFTELKDTEMDKEINDEFNSGDVRWQNPLSLQQTMLAPPEQGEGPTPGTDEFEAQAQEHENLKRIANAKSRYDLLKKKKNKSLADVAELHSVAQITARNK